MTGSYIRPVNIYTRLYLFGLLCHCSGPSVLLLALSGFPPFLWCAAAAWGAAARSLRSVVAVGCVLLVACLWVLPRVNLSCSLCTRARQNQTAAPRVAGCTPSHKPTNGDDGTRKGQEAYELSTLQRAWLAWLGCWPTHGTLHPWPFLSLKLLSVARSLARSARTNAPGLDPHRATCTNPPTTTTTTTHQLIVTQPPTLLCTCTLSITYTPHRLNVNVHTRRRPRR